jgi:hypothetical protein
MPYHHIDVKLQLLLSLFGLYASGKGMPSWRKDAPAAATTQLRHVPLPVNDGESLDDDSILAGIEETRIRLSRNIELLPPPLAHHNDNSAVAAAALLSSEYSSDDMAADEADLKYMCPLTQCFATEDPVVFQQQIYKRAMLQTYFRNYDGGDINIPHPVHRTLVARTLFELALSSQVSASSLQCEAQEAALSYESRVERRDVYNRCQRQQEPSLVSEARSTASARQHNTHPDDALLPDYYERTELLALDQHSVARDFSPHSYEYLVRRPRTPVGQQHPDKPDTPPRLRRSVGQQVLPELEEESPLALPVAPLLQNRLVVQPRRPRGAAVSYTHLTLPTTYC